MNKKIIEFLDIYLAKTGKSSIGPVEANAELAKARILPDSQYRPGKPLRDLLRKGELPHAYQSGGKGSQWTIPHSINQSRKSSNYPLTNQVPRKSTIEKSTAKDSTSVDTLELKIRLEKARLKYKPNRIKYLLIAEAPPDSIERFFYYEKVSKHDYLFLGVAQALYPDLKEKFLSSGRNSEIKNSILVKLKSDGFFLMDLCELPLSFMRVSLYSQLPKLIKKIKQVADQRTTIILIKATVYDTAFHYLQKEGFENVINVRIPFPGQGGQKIFQTKFSAALELAKTFNKD